MCGVQLYGARQVRGRLVELLCRDHPAERVLHRADKMAAAQHARMYVTHDPLPSLPACLIRLDQHRDIRQLSADRRLHLIRAVLRAQARPHRLR